MTVSATPQPQGRTRSQFGGNLSMIGLGIALVAVMLVILTFFNTANADRRATTVAERKPRPIVLSQPGRDLAPAQVGSVEDQIRALIARANQAFIEARSQANTTALLPVATGEWLAQEQNYATGLRNRGQTERWRLLNLSFVTIEVQGNGAFVCTNERWEVVTVNSNGTTGPARVVSYTEGYHLVRSGTNWLITRIDLG